LRASFQVEKIVTSVSIRGAIFDLDGLLADTEGLHMRASNEVLDNFGLRLSQDDFQEFIGTNERTFWSALIERLEIPSTISELQKMRDEIILAEVDSGMEPLPGARSLIRDLEEGGVRLAVASSSPSSRVPRVLTALGLKEQFDAIITGDLVSSPKPDPEIFLLAAKGIDVEPKACVVFEDSQPGVEGAVAAGMRCVAVPNEHTLSQNFDGATFVVGSLEEVDWREMF